MVQLIPVLVFLKFSLEKKRDDLANNSIFLFEFSCLDCNVSNFLDNIACVFQKRGKIMTISQGSSRFS